jgi:predicted adenylyl cyclase CyaB
MITPGVRGLNLERKCRCDSLAAARAALAALPARREGGQVQVDTYYHAHRGRLKLRVIDAARAELIWYDRPDGGSVRASAYQRTPAADPAGLHAALAEGLGVRAVVRKTREVWHWHNVRIHLDEVDGLGSFVELEAVLDAGNDEAASLVRLEALAAVLKMTAAADVACGYADLGGA